MSGVVGVDQAMLTDVRGHLPLNVMSHFNYIQTCAGRIVKTGMPHRFTCTCTVTCSSMMTAHPLVLPLAITCGRTSFVQDTSLVWGVAWSLWSLRDSVEMPTIFCVLHLSELLLKLITNMNEV